MGKPIRVVIAGSRNYTDYSSASKFICENLSAYEKKSLIIVSGGCRGADSLGERFAAENGISVEKYPAEWKKYGKGAGLVRNMKMAEICDFAICFWDGKSKGTFSMIDYCRKLNKKVIIKFI